MEVYFNELSLNPEMILLYQDISRMKVLYDHLREQHINSCRISNDDYFLIINKAKELSYCSHTALDFLYSFLKKPYESQTVEEHGDEYLSSCWMYQEKSCFGFALAYINDSLSISIGTEEWNLPEIPISKDTSIVTCRNLYGEDTWQYNLSWIECLSPVELIKCITSPEKKPIKLRDDHGKDTLSKFAKKIVYNEYVCEIINSRPFSKSGKFIQEVKPDGIIEIVLPWTDERLGMVIKTTGRNLRETNEIANILKDKYGSLD